MITTSRFSGDAHAYVSKIENKIVLIDGEQLSGLMIDNNLGSARWRPYQVKKIDTEYFTE